jgi:lipoate-protein ligase A
MILLENDSTDASFYFAAEEYIMQTMKPKEPVLMLWRTGDTVMIGANQIVKAEIDEAYAKEAGVDIVRRPSGGGTIFTDEGTLQYTVILPYDEKSQYNEKSQYDETQTEADPKACMREWLAEPLIETLGKLGVSASLEGRNDVAIDGKKISGLAQHVRSGYICSHGSLLFSTDLEKLARVLTVDKEKITSKAIASVSARVAKISDYLEIQWNLAVKDIQGAKGATGVTGVTQGVPPIVSFREAFIDNYRDSQKEKTTRRRITRRKITRKVFYEDELIEIEKIKQEKYDNDEWTYGREPAFTYTNKKRFPGGQVEVFLDIKGNVIRNAVIKGDFLALRPIEEIEKSLTGAPHKEVALREALHVLDINNILGSITEEELLETLL